MLGGEEGSIGIGCRGRYMSVNETRKGRKKRNLIRLASGEGKRSV